MKYFILVFINFGCGFYHSKSVFLSEAPTSRYKCKIIFVELCFYLHQLIKSPIFLTFYFKLKILIFCELEGLRELLLRHMLISGLNNKKLQECLLRESNPDFNKTVEICRIVEVTRSQVHVIKNNSIVNPDYNIDEIRRQFSNDQKSQKQSCELIMECKFCSFLHKRSSFPTYEKLCNNC